MLTQHDNDIVACPSSWYLAMPTADLRRGQVKPVSIGDHELVLFRDRAGEAHALRAHCIHMGCHLKHGTVIEDRLRCPLHYRQFDGAGRCRTAPGSQPGAAPSQPTYPSLEQFGGLFVFLGTGSAFPFPQPHDRPSGSHMTLVTRSFEIPLPWYALVANGCDLDHLQTVHLRRLKEQPIVGEISPHEFQVRYRTRIIGNGLADRVMRWLSGDDIRATITCFGGSLMLVESKIKARQTFLLLSMKPQKAGTCVQFVVGQARGRWRVLDLLSIRITAWLFLSFLRRDIGILDQQKLHRPDHLLTDGDRYVAKLFDYFESLDKAPHVLPRREIMSR
ncbi:MAG TPA: Rieske (2Fe-2S) protein [Dongiaceae bacterium]|nr:Rieske (2Fe-2S) protein [Dongiaceae bacterium]